MPTFSFEGMDATGLEIKNTIEARTEEEAQAKIRQMGYFVTKINALQSIDKNCLLKKKSSININMSWIKDVKRFIVPTSCFIAGWILSRIITGN